jgi:hypothetical protein
MLALGGPPGGDGSIPSRSMREKVREAVGMAVLCLMCCAGSLVWAVIKVAAQDFPLIAFAIVGGGYAVHRAARTIRGWQTVRWLAAEGWQPASADQPWPWLPLIERGQTEVHRTWTRTLDSLPLTVGEITWDGNALNGSVSAWKGRGVFVVVTLPTPTEPMALRRPHRTIGTSDRLNLPAMHAAYEAGEIPPWTAMDDRLFTFTAIPGQLRAEQVRVAAQQTLHVVRLMDLDGLHTTAADDGGCLQAEIQDRDQVGLPGDFR